MGRVNWSLIWKMNQNDDLLHHSSIISANCWKEFHHDELQIILFDMCLSFWNWFSFMLTNIACWVFVLQNVLNCIWLIFCKQCSKYETKCLMNIWDMSLESFDWNMISPVPQSVYILYWSKLMFLAFKILKWGVNFFFNHSKHKIRSWIIIMKHLTI